MPVDSDNGATDGGGGGCDDGNDCNNDDDDGTDDFDDNDDTLQYMISLLVWRFSVNAAHFRRGGKIPHFERHDFLLVGRFFHRGDGKFWKRRHGPWAALVHATPLHT